MLKWLLKIAKLLGFCLTPEEKLAWEKEIQAQEELRRRISDDLWI